MVGRTYIGQHDTRPDAVDPTGYDPEDIIKAPLEPPKVDKKKDTPPPRTGQRRSLLVGFLIVLVAIAILPFFGIVSALIVAAAGAIFIAVGTMLRF